MTTSKLNFITAIFSCVALAAPAAAERQTPAESAAADVVLQADGTLMGRIINSEGRAIDGAVVTLADHRDVLGQTTTDAEGVYRFSLERGGVYRLTAGQTSREFRVWPPQAAPPGAGRYATLVDGKQVVRGQIGGSGIATALGVTSGVAGLTLGIIAIDSANNAEDEAEELRAIIESMSP